MLIMMANVIALCSDQIKDNGSVSVWALRAAPWLVNILFEMLKWELKK